MLINASACFASLTFTRPLSEIKVSFERVINTFAPELARRLATSFAVVNAKFFSIDDLPEVPGSYPPCPASTTIILSFKAADEEGKLAEVVEPAAAVNPFDTHAV